MRSEHLPPSPHKIERLKALLHKREEEIEFLQETVAREVCCEMWIWVSPTSASQFRFAPPTPQQCSERQELIAALERAREEALGRHLQAAPNSAPLPRRSMAGGPLPKMPSRPPSSASSLGSSATPRSSLSASSGLCAAAVRLCGCGRLTAFEA